MSSFIVRPGDSITIGSPDIPAPSDIATFLRQRGWSDNSGTDWQHHDKQRWSLTWEQAIACEFFEFITLGGR